MDNFNTKYRAWKESMVKLINEGGIPLAVVDDFLTTLKAEIQRALIQEAQTEAQKEAESLQSNAVDDVV